MSPVLAAAAPTAQPNARFLSDLTIPDDTEIAFGQVFTKKWLVENNGDATWGDGYALVFTEGTQMNADAERPLPLTLPGAKAVIAIDFTTPDRPGSYFSDWRFRDPDGHLFGDIVFTRITAVPPAPVGISNSRFVADVSIPDDSVIAAGAPITKTWRVKNTGTRAWGPGFTLRFTGGSAMTAATTQPLPATQPGREVDISLDLAAPALAPYGLRGGLDGTLRLSGTAAALAVRRAASGSPVPESSGGGAGVSARSGWPSARSRPASSSA
jgi:hypothetical protein